MGGFKITSKIFKYQSKILNKLNLNNILFRHDDEVASGHHGRERNQDLSFLAFLQLHPVSVGSRVLQHQMDQFPGADFKNQVADFTELFS